MWERQIVLCTKKNQNGDLRSYHVSHQQKWIHTNLGLHATNLTDLFSVGTKSKLTPSKMRQLNLRLLEDLLLHGCNPCKKKICNINWHGSTLICDEIKRIYSYASQSPDTQMYNSRFVFKQTQLVLVFIRSSHCTSSSTSAGLGPGS
jgi:hypothetical protein